MMIWWKHPFPGMSHNLFYTKKRIVLQGTWSSAEEEDCQNALFVYTPYSQYFVIISPVFQRRIDVGEHGMTRVAKSIETNGNKDARPIQ